ncbi:hypothetical protein [Sporomusa aerivorans]|uniref:hypothetical protein n=1 Tax=Sporomusa aerivorans TaxID=204936 RepID=UPI00352ABC0C
MIKKILSLLFIIFSIPSAICLSNPALDDYSAGTFSIDLHLGIPDNHSTIDQLYTSYIFTAGLGSGFAGQYVYHDAEADNGGRRIKSTQINILKSEHKGLSFMIGSSQTELVGNYSRTDIIAGVQGTVYIGSNTRAYTSMSAGPGITAYSVAIGYSLTPNTELKLNYSDLRYKDLAPEVITVKVPYGGIVYRF